MYDNYAYIIETDTIIKYDECLSLEHKDKWHDVICQRRNFVGTGYIMNYDIYGNLCPSTSISLIYVNK